MLLIQITHTKIGFKDFKIKNLVEFQDLYIQSDTLLLADVFENFQNACLEAYELEAYELDAACIFTIKGLALQVALKNTKTKLDLLTDIDKL